MIRSIHLRSFGKFRDFLLDCAPVTVVQGANESGKTTLVDAILEGVCKPKGNNEAVKFLKQRYGEERAVEVAFDKDPPPSLSWVDFLNLLAIRAGDLSVEVSRDTDLITRIKAQLFSGGIDPNEAAKWLDTQCASSSKGTLRREYEEAKAELERLDGELRQLQDNRERATREEEEAKAAEAKLAEVQTELEKVMAEEKEIARSLEQEDYHRALREIEQAWKTILQAQELEENLRSVPSYTEEEERALKAEQEGIDRLGADVLTLEVQREALEKEMKELRGLEEQLKAEEEKAQRLVNRGLALKTPLMDKSSYVDIKVEHSLSLPFLLLAMGALLLGFLLSWIVPRDLFLLPLTVGVLGSMLLGFLGVRKTKKEDDSRFQGLLQRACEEWAKEGGEPVPEAKWDQFVAVVERTQERAHQHRARLEDTRGRLKALQKQLSGIAEQIQRLNREREEKARSLAEKCSRLKVQDVSHYRAQRMWRGEREALLAERHRELERALKTYRKKDREELKAYLSLERDRIQKLVVEDPLEEEQVRMLKNKAQKLKERRDSLEKEKDRLQALVHRARGQISGAYRDLPQRIVKLQSDRLLAEASLKEKELALEGARIAREMLKDLSSDQERALQRLSDEIASTFTRIAPAKGKEGKREVVLKEFSVKKSEVTDREGNRGSWSDKERGEFLSTGTRDSFLLAARLVLAKKAVPGGSKAFLVLDEPLLTLDAERVERALEVLKEFQKETGWQLFFFTKEKELGEKVLSLFGNSARRVILK